jgi:acyl dehydratase
MGVSWGHVLHQGPVLAGIARVGLTSAGVLRRPAPMPIGTTLEAELPARPTALLEDFVRHVGGSPSAWRGVVPPHLYSQWTFPLFSQLLLGLSYDLRKVLNGGARVVVNQPLPAGEPLFVRARLDAIDDDGRRALVRLTSTTGTVSAPDAIQGDLHCFVPLAKAKGEGKGAGKEAATVGVQAREIATWRLNAQAGRDFALLTGDFNPIHWIPAAGRMAGFGGCILHGYGTMARAWEGLIQGVHAGDIHALRSMEVRFTRPLRLPGAASLFVEALPTADEAGRFTVGRAPGSPANLVGTWNAP